jgi:hypothetical protein
MRNKTVAIFLIAIFAVLSFIAFSPSPILAQTGTSTLNPASSATGSSSGSGWSISSVTKFGLPNSTLSNIITNILLWLLGILGVVGVIGFVVSGLMYLLSAGSDDMMTKAKKGLMYSLIGIVVGLAGVVIIQAVSSILSGATTF